jgi:hypothetical protein
MSSYTTTTVLTVSTADDLRQALIEEIEDRLDQERISWMARRRPNAIQSHGHDMRVKTLTDLLRFLTDLRIEEKRENAQAPE